MTLLTTITIPSSVASIGSEAFGGCSGLSSIIVEEGNTMYDSRDNCNAIIVSASNTLLYGCQNTIIPTSVTQIENYAFSGCSNLYSIIIPNNVTSVGDYAFNDCSSLSEVTLSDNITTIKRHTFNNCTQLESIVIGSNVKDIESDAFSSCPLTSVTIKSNAITSKDYTTSKNIAHIFGSQVENYILGSNISRVGYYAFDGCSNVKTMTFQSYNVPSYHTSAFNNLKNGTTTYVPCGRKEAYDLVFSSGGGMQYIFKTQYAPLKYQITGFVNNEEMGSVIVPQTECDYLVAEANYGYHFDHWSDGSTYSYRSITLTQDTILQAFFEKNSYTIRTESSQSEGGTTFGDTTALYLDTVTIAAIVNEHYHFVRWNDGDMNAIRQVSVTEDKTYTAIFEKDKFLVLFKDDDGTELKRDSVEYGVMPIAPTNPSKASTAQYEYSFNGWNPVIVEVTQNAIFTATYTSAIRSYTVTFLNEDGSEISSVVYQYGQTPIAPSDPTKSATAEYTYTFAGWDKPIAQVQGDATYRATFNATKNSYTITWQNEDGSLIDQTMVKYGVIPTHADPVKQNTVEYTYTFAGWTPNVVAVTGDATYRATFSSEVNMYSITANVINGEVEGVGVYPYGTEVTLTAIPNDGYAFDQWSDGVKDNPRTIIVFGDAEYTALFTSTEGIDNLVAPENVRKVIINGQIFILRGEKTYTLTGQEVK